MVKKSNGWNLQDMQATLVKDTEQKISDGFEEIRNEQKAEVPAGSPAVPSQQPLEPVRNIADQPTRRMYHKERTQDVLVHCPASLHRQLTELKNHRWDEYGERVTINNMIVDAIAQWLDGQTDI